MYSYLGVPERCAALRARVPLPCPRFRRLFTISPSRPVGGEHRRPTPTHAQSASPAHHGPAAVLSDGRVCELIYSRGRNTS